MNKQFYLQALKKIKSYCMAVRRGSIIINDSQRELDLANHTYSTNYILNRIENIIDYSFNLAKIK